MRIVLVDANGYVVLLFQDLVSADVILMPMRVDEEHHFQHAFIYVAKDLLSFRRNLQSWVNYNGVLGFLATNNVTVCLQHADGEHLNFHANQRFECSLKEINCLPGSLSIYADK